MFLARLLHATNGSLIIQCLHDPRHMLLIEDPCLSWLSIKVLHVAVIGPDFLNKSRVRVVLDRLTWPTSQDVANNQVIMICHDQDVLIRRLVLLVVF